jgi:tRNA(Ile)-lysidine synthase
MTLLEELKIFLDEHLCAKRPVLLGFSGGIDSMALLHLLLKYKPNLDLHLAHFDHAQREESARQVFDLKKLAASKGLPFLTRRLDKPIQGNLEDFFRKERFSFFKDIYRQGNYQALMLAHQRDDLIETVLKRIFEGAPLTKLTAMERVQVKEEIPILRPLLNWTKKELTQWLKKVDDKPIIDSTNFDERFLRARFRKSIVPLLEEKFGKKIHSNLVEISRASKKLTDYLEQLPFLVSKSVFGTLLDLRAFSHSYEVEYLIKKCLNQEGISAKKSTLAEMQQWIIEKRANKTVEFKNRVIVIDRGYLIALRRKKVWSAQIPLKEGSYKNITIKKVPYARKSSWQDLFTGKIYVPLFSKDLALKPLEKNEPYQKEKSLKKWLSQNKVPAALFNYSFAIFDSQKIFYEFLTGKDPRKSQLSFEIEFS